MANETKNLDVVLIPDQSGGVRKIRINGAEYPVAGASPIMSGTALGVSITLVGVNLSSEPLPPPADPLSATN